MGAARADAAHPHARLEGGEADEGRVGGAVAGLEPLVGRGEELGAEREAELGVQQLCELAPVAGIEIVGPLPEPVQRLTHFAAGIPANAANPEGALALVELLGSAAAREAMVEGGMHPATSAAPSPRRPTS